MHPPLQCPGCGCKLTLSLEDPPAALKDQLKIRYKLNELETDVLTGVMEGLDNFSIAATIGRSTNVVKNYVSILFNKFGANNRVQLVNIVNAGTAYARHTKARDIPSQPRS